MAPLRVRDVLYKLGQATAEQVREALPDAPSNSAVRGMLRLLEPLTGWDDREGTARRYLRASGRIGRGDARVVVRTVNGEIEIRRR